ncbi:phosphatidylserine decarboxylase [Candidatus Gracilibacteria bacterium]|nr:phosphatidylserine decarboxylase [Candidatus Gracilibacteria bacterium]
MKEFLFILVVLAFLLGGGYKFYFLRLPERNIPLEENVFVSPANGKVVNIIHWDKEQLAIEKDKNKALEVFTGDVGERGALVSISMNLHNVHYQRAPIASTLISKKHEEGKFLNAVSNPRATWENEHNVLLFKTENGLRYKVIQIAGMMARRIEDFLETGQKVKTGEVIGLIKLGSQVSIVLPEEVEILVKEGDVVIDGESVIGKWQTKAF